MTDASKASFRRVERAGDSRAARGSPDGAKEASARASPLVGSRRRGGVLRDPASRRAQGKGEALSACVREFCHAKLGGVYSEGMSLVYGIP